MYGFTITVNGKNKAKQGDICYKNIVCSNRMIKKFEQDKVFAETERYIVLLDGVVLNRKQIVSNFMKIADGTWCDVLIKLYEENGELFFTGLRGSFSGALYDKKASKWIIFGDQIGSKFTFYSRVGDFFCCCEEMGHMYYMLKDNGITYDLNPENSMLLLTYGFMLDGRTLCNEIHKINPGCYLVLQNGVLEEKRYYLLDNTPDYSINEKDAVELIDYYFRQAVVRQFEKDEEYGFPIHLVALSGGLDCRMTSFVAHDCGYKQQLNMTFSQSDYWDQTLPMRMSAALKHEWIFKSLDNGTWLFDVDEITRTTGGNVLYYGTAHGNSLFKYLNFEHLGLQHSGQIGDAIIGSFVTAKDWGHKYEIGSGAYSTQYLNYLKGLQLALDVNSELGMFYYRAFNGTNNGIQNLYNYTETLSPFLDLDMIEKALSIPIELRQHHYIYKKWILAKYPLASEFEWEKTGHKITEKMVRLNGRYIALIDAPGRIWNYMLKKTGIKSIDDNIKNMNPVSYYVTHNEELRNYLNTYFDFVDCIKDPELRGLIAGLQTKGTVMERLQAVSLLSAVKLFYMS